MKFDPKDPRIIAHEERCAERSKSIQKMLETGVPLPLGGSDLCSLKDYDSEWRSKINKSSPLWLGEMLHRSEQERIIRDLLEDPADRVIRIHNQALDRARMEVATIEKKRGALSHHAKSRLYSQYGIDYYKCEGVNTEK